MARADCASTLVVTGAGSDLRFGVEGIGAAQYRFLDGDHDGDFAVAVLQSAAACHADPACMTDPGGALAETVKAVADDPSGMIEADASINLRKVVGNSGSGLFGDVDDLAPPSARLALVRVGAARVLVLQTSLGLFDEEMSGPVTVAVLGQAAEASLCPE